MANLEFNTLRVLIPAAGFGKRVGSPAAKELLRYQNESLPIIDWSINLALNIGAKPLVITRADKLPLLEYLENRDNVDVQLVGNTQEWPDTLLQSEPFWFERNIVLLPDTRFDPIQSLEHLSESLIHSPTCFALFDVDSVKSWGAIGQSGTSYYIGEKPYSEISKIVGAWGIFGFQKKHGANLLSLMLEGGVSHEWKPLSHQPYFYRLNYFEDITRDNSKIVF